MRLNIQEKEGILEDKRVLIKGLKLEKEMLKDAIMERLDYLLKHPSIIKGCGLTLKRVLMHKIRCKGNLRPSNLSSEFTQPEKLFIVGFAYLQFEPEALKKRS